MVRLAQPVHISCADTNTISKWTKMRFHMTHVTKEFRQERPKRFTSLWYVRSKPCTYLASRLAISLNGPKQAYTSASSPMVRLVQTVHLSCTDTNTISKWIETRFDMSHVTEEFRRVRPKWFTSLWYIWCKPCTYLVSWLALSPNGSKWAYIWASSPRSTICFVQNDSRAYGMFGANCAPFLHWH
jgi:hypothetical protein